jgi:DNA replication protein DnaC
MTDEIETIEPAHCDAHGPFQQRVLTPGFAGMKPFRMQCPECSANAKALREAAERKERAAERARKVAALTGEAGIPLRFQSRTFDNYVATAKGQKVALSVCKRFAGSFQATKEHGTSIVMTGGPGTGKTHLACATANAVIASDLAVVRFITVSEMMRRIKETYRKDSPQTESSVVEGFIWPDLLIVDEIGVQVGSDHEKLLLFDVLNGRYQNLRPTILLSNLSADELEAYLGHRVMDRYRECGTVLAFDWQSHRGAA